MIYLITDYSFINFLYLLGTTWLCCILDLLYFGEMSPERQTSIPIFKRVQLLEGTFTLREGDLTITHLICQTGANIFKGI